MQYNFDEPVSRYSEDSYKWRFADQVFGGENLLPMWIADMDFPVARPIVEAIKARAEQGVFGYTARPDSLYEAIEGWMKRRHGWQIEREWICHSPGVIPALAACVQSFTAPGDAIVIQPPVYPPFANVVAGHGRRLVANPLRNADGYYEMDFDDLRCKLEEHRPKMMIFCSPHNPVGRVWTKEELERLAALCDEYGVLVVSDEIHADLAFEKGSHIPFATVGREAAARSIICMAPSKTFNVAGLMTSFVFIPDESLRGAFRRAMEEGHHVMTNTFGIAASESGYRHGDEWLDQCLAYIRGNMAYAERYIAQQLPELKTTRAEGTYLLWLDCTGLGMDPERLQRFMVREIGIALSSGADFGKEGEGFLRMNIACRRATLEEGLSRIEKAVKQQLTRR